MLDVSTYVRTLSFSPSPSLSLALFSLFLPLFVVVFVVVVHHDSLQVRFVAHDLSCRLSVLDALKGSHDTSHHGGAYAGIYLGDPDIGELTISEMSPEDIRAELKRFEPTKNHPSSKCSDTS